MNRVIILVSILFVMLALGNVYAESSPSVYIDGELIRFDSAPYIDQETNRTMVPMRKIFETLGAKVTWNAESQTVFGMKGDISIILRIKNKVASVNGKNVELDQAAIIKNGRTMVPLRFISEALGAKVEWDSKANSVYITSPLEIEAMSPYQEGELIIDDFNQLF